MTTHAKQLAGAPGGRTSYSGDESASLVVATGAPDDHRQALQPGNGDLRAQAEIALAEQDAWSDEHHSGFWQALLPLWPRRSGTVPVRQRLDALAGYLLNVAVAANWSRADVANILGVAPDSLRRRRYGFGDRKARWWPGTGDRRDRLPRVYREGDPKPDGHPAVRVEPPQAPALEQLERTVRSAVDRATPTGLTPAIIAVFALSDGSISTLFRGRRDRPDEIFATAETADGYIAYDPIRVALGLEWLSAPAPTPLGEWEPVETVQEGADDDRAH